MNNSNKKYGRRTSIATVAAILLAAAAYIFAGNYNDIQNPGNAAGSQAELQTAVYTFRTEELLLSHYEKHGEEMGFATPEEYEAAAARVLSHPDVLYKPEAEDGDFVYYLEETNEFVIVSKDGYIRTYFYPDRGMDYFNMQ